MIRFYSTIFVIEYNLKEY